MFITTRQAALLLQVNEGELIFELERAGLFKGCQLNMFDNRKGRTRKFSYEDVMAVKRKLHSDKEVKGH
ncbi:hypothetical protein ACR2W6_26730 [Klebsiella pneumoniae]